MHSICYLALMTAYLIAAAAYGVLLFELIFVAGTDKSLSNHAVPHVAAPMLPLPIAPATTAALRGVDQEEKQQTLPVTEAASTAPN